YDLSKASYNHDFDSVAYQLGGGTVLVAEAGVAHYGGQAMSNGFNAVKAKIPTKLKGSLYNGDLNFGRGKNKIRPDINAQGAHSVFKRDPVTGGITNYRTYAPNPQNPTGFDEILGYDGVGGSHHNKFTGQDVGTPHVHDPATPGNVRPPHPWEIP
ncbi:MAG: hypothetical protein GX365_06645, partial [Clostridiales bacterium]|nr:hypothetical protein [Clostridiales bacterium]